MVLTCWECILNSPGCVVGRIVSRFYYVLAECKSVKTGVRAKNALRLFSQNMLASIFWDIASLSAQFSKQSEWQVGWILYLTISPQTRAQSNTTIYSLIIFKNIWGFQFLPKGGFEQSKFPHLDFVVAVIKIPNKLLLWFWVKNVRIKKNALARQLISNLFVEEVTSTSGDKY